MQKTREQNMEDYSIATLNRAETDLSIVTLIDIFKERTEALKELENLLG